MKTKSITNTTNRRPMPALPRVVEPVEEEVKPYSVEELVKGLDKAEEDYKAGRLQKYHSVEDMYRAIGIL